MEFIDLRSDTVTKPSPGMLQAMVNAEVGDDVYGEDPTVNILQERIAAMFGKEASLFVPSGTMGNEICIKVQTRPGDEVIVEQDSHIYVYETAAPPFLAGVQMALIPGKSGVITPEQILNAIRPSVYYLPSTTLICLENTHGRSAGSVIPIDAIREIRKLSLQKNIRMHLDGARVWNASIASGVPLKEYGRYFDSLSVCFSKGLGAPIGSAIIGDRPFIEEARRYRKIFGGGMRQVGFIAAAALYALDHNIGRLAEDHEKARIFATAVCSLEQLAINLEEVQTNMVIIEISRTGKSQAEVLSLLKTNGLLVTPERSSSIRAVMHLDVSVDDVQRAAAIVRSIFH